MKVDIIDIVDLLRSREWLGGGEFTEIAKGKNQMVYTWKGFKRKIRRVMR